MIGLIEFMEDVTARRTAEKALRESEQKFRATFDTALVGIDIVDRDGRFLEANSALCKSLGYSLDELRLSTILDVTHPDDLNRSREFHEAMVAGQREGYRFQKRHIRKDGGIIWADTAVSALRGPDGGCLATIGVISDITE
ncbi:MAG: PAS domain-containing protein [Desulfomonilaceae bacterium]